MPEHNFTLIISGPVDDKLDELHVAGCSDALFGDVDGVHFAEFDRESPTWLIAVMSAIAEIDSVEGLRVDRIEPDELVTASEIAERMKVSRESIRLTIAGKRGNGDFPPPITHLRSRNRLWRWSDVVAWTRPDDVTEQIDGALVAALNSALESRRVRPLLPEGDVEAIRDLIGS